MGFLNAGVKILGKAIVSVAAYKLATLIVDKTAVALLENSEKINSFANEKMQSMQMKG